MQQYLEKENKFGTSIIIYQN